MDGGKFYHDFVLVIYHVLLLIILGTFDRFSADSDEVMDGLLDGSTDESIDVWMERGFPRLSCFGRFCTGILTGIFTKNLLMVGWTELMMDILADRQSSRWNHILVGRQMSHVVGIWTDLS